jgi:hypothetical protein
MQTWLVHMRHPLQLSKDLGFNGFMTFQAIVGGNALVALAHPAFLMAALWELRALLFNDRSPTAMLFFAYYVLTASFGYFVSAIFGWRGLRYRNVQAKIQILAWTPVHLVLVSVAAYWAAGELILSPFRWRKTEHGSDRAAWLESTVRPLLILERYLTDLKRNGELPQIWNDVTDSAVNRRQLPRVAA